VILPELVQADVVYLGKITTTRKTIKAEIIQKLKQRNPKIAIAMEMFQRPYQGVLDRYLAGQVSEQELLSKASTTKGGASWGYYAPILRFARKKHRL